MTKRRDLQLTLDRVAVFLAAACVLHCALTPIALVLFPVFAATALGDTGFHKVMVSFIIPSSGLAFGIGCRKHKDIFVLFAGAVGLALLVTLAFVGHQLLGEIGERLLTIVAACILSVGHIRNAMLCRKDGCEK